MKRLLALLALLYLGPAMAQVDPAGTNPPGLNGYVSPYANATQTGNLVPDYSFDGTWGTTPVGWNLQGSNYSGGAIQAGCGALSNLGQCFQFSYMGATLSTSIDLTQYNTKDFEFYFDFYYRMNCNNSIGGYCGNLFGPQDLFGASVQFFTTGGEAGYFNFIPIGTDYFVPGEPGVNEFGYKGVGWYSSQTAQNLFTSAVISFYGQDTGFWGGYYGPSLDRVNFHIGYLETPTVTTNCTTDPWMLECKLLSLTDPITIATNTDTSAPPTAEAPPPPAEAPPPPAQETAVAENSSSSNEQTLASTIDAPAPPPPEAAPPPPEASGSTTTLASTDTQTSSSLQAQDNSKQLSDGINSSLLQLVLSIVDTTSQQQETKTATTSTTSASVSTETAQTASVSEETAAETQAGDMSMEILATGVAMNNASQQELQNNIQDSLALSEQIIQMGTVDNSNSNNNTVDTGTDTQQMIVDNTDNTSVVQEEQTNLQDGSDTTVMVADNNDDGTASMSEVLEPPAVNDDSDALDIINNSVVASNNETMITDEIIPQPVASNTTDDTEEQAVVVNKTFEDQSDTELLASILESASLAQAVMASIQPYNFEPSVTDREMLGVMGKKEEDKSDAEKRADKIVAANKEEQDNIRSNYFEADQAGILGAIEGTTDVTSYRAAVLPDASTWYKPEQIYKNVTYKDNSRSLYFLEKGSTDTYKKMVQEQYK